MKQQVYEGDQLGLEDLTRCGLGAGGIGGRRVVVIGGGE